QHHRIDRLGKTAEIERATGVDRGGAHGAERVRLAAQQRAAVNDCWDGIGTGAGHRPRAGVVLFEYAEALELLTDFRDVETGVDHATESERVGHTERDDVADDLPAGFEREAVDAAGEGDGARLHTFVAIHAAFNQAGVD